MNTQTLILNYIKGLNPSSVTMSSIGNVISAMDQQLADDKRVEVMAALNQDTLAYSIASTANRFSDKQLSAIAIELQKNAGFVASVAKYYDSLQNESKARAARKSAKANAKKADQKNVEETIAANVSALSGTGINSAVMHASFGKGVIISQDDTTVTVLFDSVGEKKMMKAYSRLQSI